MTLYKRIYPWLLFAFLGTFAWGTSFFWIKIALRELSPFEVVAWRMTFGAMALWVLAMLKGLDMCLNKKLFIATFILALLLMVFPITLITWSETLIPSNVAGLLNSLTPMFTVILTIILVNKKHDVSKQQAIGISIGFLGVLLIFLRNLSADAFTHHILPQLAVMISSVFYALGTIYAKQKLGNSNPIILTLYALIWSAIILWSVVFMTTDSILIPSNPRTWISLIWLGVICNAIANVIFFTINNVLGSAIASSVAYLFPLTAYFLGVLLLGESFSIRELVGGITTMCGIYITNRKRKIIPL